MRKMKMKLKGVIEKPNETTEVWTDENLEGFECRTGFQMTEQEPKIEDQMFPTLTDKMIELHMSPKCPWLAEHNAIQYGLMEQNGELYNKWKKAETDLKAANRLLKTENERSKAKLKDAIIKLEGVSIKLDFLEFEINSLYNEIDCRVEHGADSKGHLEYVRDKMKEIQKKFR